MCSAAATRGLTTSQFAITKVLGTLPSVWQIQKGKIEEKNNLSHKNAGQHAVELKEFSVIFQVKEGSRR